MRTKLLILALLLASACGPSTGVGTFVYEYTPPPPDMASQPRLYSDAEGTLHDRLLNDQPCAWAISRGCEKRCFPENLWPVCWGGKFYYYSRQGLTTVFKYGRVTTLQDPACHGEDTSILVDLDLIPDAQRPLEARDCKNEGILYTTLLHDRNIYSVAPSAVLPASAADLPGQTDGGGQ